MTRRPTLRAVAKSRGMHSRRAAEAGLRAALLAMPVKKEKKR